MEIVPLLASEDANPQNAAIVLGQIGQRAVVPASMRRAFQGNAAVCAPQPDPCAGAAGRHGGTASRQGAALPEGTDKNTLAERDAIQKALSRLGLPQKSRTFTTLLRPVRYG